MSEIVHPSINLDSLSANSLEQNFAQSAALLLIDCNFEREEVVNQTEVTTRLTPRVDMDSSTYHLTAALRLRSVPLTGVLLELIDCEADPAVLVIAMEHATFNEYLVDPKDDESLPWQPYIYAILNDKQPDKARVVNANTGKDLRAVDLQMARVLLNKLCEELNNLRCEDADLAEQLRTTYRLVPKGPDLVKFEPAEFINTEPCEEVCVNKHFSCGHSTYSEN